MYCWSLASIDSYLYLYVTHWSGYCVICYWYEWLRLVIPWFDLTHISLIPILLVVKLWLYFVHVSYSQLIVLIFGHIMCNFYENFCSCTCNHLSMLYSLSINIISFILLYIEWTCYLIMEGADCVDIKGAMGSTSFHY